jgi:hypothetical protein
MASWAAQAIAALTATAGSFPQHDGEIVHVYADQDVCSAFELLGRRHVLSAPVRAMFAPSPRGVLLCLCYLGPL